MRSRYALPGGGVMALLLLSTMACARGPELQTFTWQTSSGRAVSVSAPLNWEWDTGYIERVKGGDVEATGLRTAQSEETPGYADAIIAVWEGPIDEWVEVLSETVMKDSDGDLIEHKTWSGEVNGAEALFRRDDRETNAESFKGYRLLEVYVMPEGNEWAWRVGCQAMLAHEHHVEACEILVNSVRSE